MSNGIPNLKNLDKRVERIHKLIIELASGNLKYRVPPSEEHDELDAILIGINMLGEELEASTVSRDYLESIYRGVVDMLLVLNPNNTIQKVNETTTRLLGYGERELLGKDFSFLIADDGSRSLDSINDELTRNSFCYNIEKQFKTKEGGVIPVSFSCSILYDNKNRVNGKLFIAKDISHIKRAEEQLVLKNEELNTFIYKASHDLKGPLASSIGLIDLMKKERNDPEALSKYLDLLGGSVHSLDGILNELLQYNSITQNPLEYTTINFDKAVEEVLYNLKDLPELKKVKINVNISLQRQFYSDRELLKPILQNLVDNALKYHRNGRVKPYININIRGLKKEVKIEVIDNGIGMPQSIIENIFTMFYRGNLRSQGSGLGLYIAKSSVDRMGGRFVVKSKEDHGSHFSVYLPY
ncbi:MAG: PAS domain S-box protein [Bacteroidetes bacterium]|nr:PAS domain S-box protein [Bacteroidota bacterium]